MKLDRKSMIRMVVAGFMLFLLIYWFMFTGQRFLSSGTSIFLGLAIAYPLNIMISFFREHDFLYQRRIIKSERVHRILTIALAVLLLAGCLAFIVLYVGPQLTASAITLLEKVPSGIRFILNQPLTARLLPEDTLEALRAVDWNKWIEHLVNAVSSDELFRGMTITASSAISGVSNLLFGILFSIYFLAGKETTLKVLKRMIRAFIPREKQQSVIHSGVLLNDCFHNFIVSQAVQALLLGISATVLMYVFRFPYASMIGSLNGFCALIPVVGGYLGAILGTLIILTDSPSMALFFLVFIVVLQNVIGTLIFPRIMGRSLGVPSVWTLAAVLVGSGLGGITGILIGVPVTAFGYKMVKEKLEEREKALALENPGEAGGDEGTEKPGEPDPPGTQENPEKEE